MDRETKKRTIYDGIKITPLARDAIVFSLSLLLLVALIAAFVMSK